jgi:hypothetical protein
MKIAHISDLHLDAVNKKKICEIPCICLNTLIPITDHVIVSDITENGDMLV